MKKKKEANSNYVGKEFIFKFQERLNNVGCKNINYIEIDKWIPLSNKWQIIGNVLDKNSEIFVLQAADCYSQPYRLKETFDLLTQTNLEYISSQIGPFYVIKSEEVFIYDTTKLNFETNLNMALLSKYMRGLPNSKKKSGVDGWLFQAASKIKGSKLIFGYNNSENWKLGFDSHGINNISKNRYKDMKKRKDIYKKSEIYNYKIEDYINKKVLKKLKET